MNPDWKPPPSSDIFINEFRQRGMCPFLNSCHSKWQINGKWVPSLLSHYQMADSLNFKKLYYV